MKNTDRLYRFFLIFLFASFCLCVLLYVREISTVKLGVPVFSVDSITGTVVYDSSFSKSGNHVMTIYLDNACSRYGQNVSCSGLVTAVGRQKAIVSCGLKIKLYGSFKEDMFVYDGFQVLDRNALNTLRERLIIFLEKRIYQDEGSDSDVLSMMLLTGRSETYGTEIRNLALACGCVHVLALSGMHLHFVTCLAKLFRNRIVRYLLSALFVLCFVFIAGPRPSLVRSAIMVLLSFIPLKERLACSLMVHILIFPLSVLNIGAVYGYVAVFALVFFAEYVGGLRFLSASIAVLTVSVPIQMAFDGCWYPVALVAGPISSVLVFVSMFLGFLICCFGHFGFLEELNRFVYRIIVGFFSFCSDFPSAGWGGYTVLFVCFVFFVSLPVALRRRNRNRAVKNLYQIIEICSKTH